MQEKAEIWEQSLQKEWQKKREEVENALPKELEAGNALSEYLASSMAYSLMAGGKRLRPILLMAAAEAVSGKDGAAYMKVACAMEMIHTYSLIHDDLPAMDNDDYRRGKLTNHRKFDEGTAILAGDGLLTLAFERICAQENVAPEALLAVVREIATAAGAAGMVGGQALDLQAEGKRIELAELKKIHLGKTGALFCAAIRSGAILAGATKAQLDALTRYAEAFGLAFQIADDILDVTGDAAALGKPVGSDLRNEKSTYVTLTSVEKAEELADMAVSEAISALSVFGEEAEFLRSMVRFAAKRDR